MAMKISVMALDFDTVRKILMFSKKNLLILTVESVDLDMLIITENFQILGFMITAGVQHERVFERKEE